jgi:RNA polymerase sigma factor (sigma-70 family)
MSTDTPWRNLQTKLLAALDRLPAASWFDIWQLFLEDAWYQAELAKHARLTLRACNAPLAWTDDVQHEAILNLAAQLQKSPDLGLHLHRGGENFACQIGTMARNDCHQALKRLRRRYGVHQALCEEAEYLAADRVYRLEDLSLALRNAIDDLPEPHSTVLRLYHAGYLLREIALLLGLTFWKVYAIFHSALERVREELRL